MRLFDVIGRVFHKFYLKKRAMAGKVTELTNNTILSMMELHRNGNHKVQIANEFGISPGFVSQIIRAYHGNLKQLSILAKEHQLLIKELSPFYNRGAINLVREHTTTWQCQVGLTKREYFAGLAMQGMLSLPKNYGDKQIMINVAIEYAEELLKQLES